jgi:hypothetical protein
MKSRISICVVVTIVLAATIGQAQNRRADVRNESAALAVQPPVHTCDYQFTVAGTTNNSMVFCVSVNGNVVSFQQPANYEYIAFGPTIGEGYGICDLGTGVAYYDFADGGASANWLAPTTVSSTAAAVKIARTTSDNLFTITQTFTKVVGTTPAAKVTMQVKNNTTLAKNIYLLRWADVHPVNAQNTGSYTESFDSTYNSVWGYTAENYNGPNFYGYGVMLENLGAPNVATYGQGGTVMTTAAAPSTCNPPSNAGYQASVDGSIMMFYLLEPIGAKKTATVNVRYIGM